jgi:putative membrane protein
MHRNRIMPALIATAALLFIQPGATLMAQAPGGGMPQSNPGGAGSPGSSPGAGTPGTMPDSTAAPQKVDDKKFVKDAAVGGLTEVELGKLAQQKASSPDVKQFAEKMVSDHTKANDQLKEVATKENIDIPSSLDSKHQSRVDKLAKLSGPDFDKAYMKDQLKDHEKDVSEFQGEAQGGSDPNVQHFATQTLPTLQQHLEMAKNVNKAAKGKD